MPLTETNQHGAIYNFGTDSSDAPAITGFVAREAELKYAPEVKEESTDGEGHADSVTVSKPANRQISGSFTGYVTEEWDAQTLADSLTFEDRFFIIDDISEPRKKGKYWEVVISATSKAGVSS